MQLHDGVHLAVDDVERAAIYRQRYEIYVEEVNRYGSIACWPPIRSLYRGRSMGPVDLKGKGALELIECLPLTTD